MQKVTVILTDFQEFHFFYLIKNKLTNISINLNTYERRYDTTQTINQQVAAQ